MGPLVSIPGSHLSLSVQRQCVISLNIVLVQARPPLTLPQARPPRTLPQAPPQAPPTFTLPQAPPLPVLALRAEEAKVPCSQPEFPSCLPSPAPGPPRLGPFLNTPPPPPGHHQGQPIPQGVRCLLPVLGVLREQPSTPT